MESQSTDSLIREAILIIFENDTENSSSESSTSESYDESSSDGIDSDVEVLLKLYKEPSSKRLCIKDYFEDIVPSYNDAEFQEHFRIRRELFTALSDNLHNSQGFQHLRVDTRLNTAEKHMAVFLWFAGHEGCSFRDLAVRFNISLWSVGAIIERVLIFVSGLSSEVITWPEEQHKLNTAAFFLQTTGIPSAIGAIDMMHIVIDPPSEDRDSYINGDGNFSLCLQAICDENKKFLDIVVGFPGSIDRRQVLENSPIDSKLQSLCGNYCIVGNSAYVCHKYLLTPYSNTLHLSSDKKLFNAKLNLCRVNIDHAFGMLKQRFRQLDHCKLKGVAKLNHFVRACCVLHNLSDESDLNFDKNLVEETNDNDTDPTHQADSTAGKIFRNLVCRQIVAKYRNKQSF